MHSPFLAGSLTFPKLSRIIQHGSVLPSTPTPRFSKEAAAVNIF